MPPVESLVLKRSLLLTCEKDYNFTKHTCKQIIDQSRKQPRPILQDQDKNRNIPVSSGLEAKSADSRTTSLNSGAVSYECGTRDCGG